MLPYFFIDYIIWEIVVKAKKAEDTVKEKMVKFLLFLVDLLKSAAEKYEDLLCVHRVLLINIVKNKSINLFGVTMK